MQEHDAFRSEHSTYEVPLEISMIARTILLLLALIAALPLAAQNDLYNNGPIVGDINAWDITTFIVSDTFTLTSSTNSVNGLSFGAWLNPGDILQSAEVSITSNPEGGTTYFAQTVAITQTGCFMNHSGYELCQETGTFNSVELGAGTYWINLTNARVGNGDEVYWDENDGQGCTSPGCPSQAFQSINGTIPSESFTIFGTVGGGSTPEPGSLLLFGSGVAGVVAWLRRSKARSN